MKRFLPAAFALFVCVVLTQCAKKSSTPVKNTATCTYCNGYLFSHASDSTGLYYFLPTAFTPNGDGINDVLRMVYSSKIVVDSSTLTIWDMNGNGVFTNTINQGWDGHDLKGNLCPAGHYPLYLHLKTVSGAVIENCGCVTILAYKGTCIYTGGVTYYFDDELDTAGFVFPTNENLCP